MDEKNIIEYYKNNVNIYNDGDQLNFLNQVGKTQLGKTISIEKFQILIDSIVNNLQIGEEDTIVDLGCANGLVSYEIAKSAKYIHAFDFSDDLINIAKKHHSTDNISFYTSNILDIDLSALNTKKLYMYEVLQHFDTEMLRHLLSRLIDSNDSFSLFVGSIPDAEKIFSFYFNEERRKYYFIEVLENKTFHIGNWWYREHLLLICRELGLDASIIEQNKKLHTAHYRFDLLIEKKQK